MTLLQRIWSKLSRRAPDTDKQPAPKWVTDAIRLDKEACPGLEGTIKVNIVDGDEVPPISPDWVGVDFSVDDDHTMIVEYHKLSGRITRWGDIVWREGDEDE